MKNKLQKVWIDEEGITFIETITSVILLSILMISLFRITTTLIPSIKKDLLFYTQHNNEIIMSDSFTRFISNVSPPWWIGEYKPIQSENQYAFPWYHGNETNHLIIQKNQAHISFYINEVLLLEIKNPGIQKLELIKDKLNHKIYVSVTIQERTFLFPIGSSILEKRLANK